VNEKLERLELVRGAWDAYHPDYMGFHLKENPNFHRDLADGAVMLSDRLIELAGDVSGQKLLDVCCAGDATQAFSWANLGAEVTACDISPVAIDIARDNAERIGLPVAFHVADAQALDAIEDRIFDIVFATYLMWFEDIQLAFRNWRRVLRLGGRLLVDTYHPVTYCLGDTDGRIVPERSYRDTAPEYYDFGGTPLAGQHGGWRETRPIVEFHHTLAGIVNAALDAGFRLKKVEEPIWVTERVLADLPAGLTALWQK
jgi:ubiquinone/menaquinone biosynthesis C-methylase UbiE